MNTLDFKISGMDCAECANNVQSALSDLPQIHNAQVLLGAEKAIISFENDPPSIIEIKRVVSNAGYEAILDNKPDDTDDRSDLGSFGKSSILFFIFVVIFVLAITLVGERQGIFETLQSLVPWYLWLTIIIIGGWPVFLNVTRAIRKGRIISHTLMSASVITATAIGEWASALLIVVFMRFGDFIEKSTTEKARQSIRKLSQMAPRFALVEIDGLETETLISSIQKDDIVVVRPGESIPVDGVVTDGYASVDQSAINGESMPVEVTKGKCVHAASIVKTGMLKVKTAAVGSETTFGKIIQLVEKAEANRGEFQRMADKFSAYYLPFVALIALGTLIIRGDPIAAASVMVVACSCSFSLATPVAMLASIGSSAEKGLLFKGGKYIESLSKADTVYIDKTGTLTIGKPSITDIILIDDISESILIQFCASAERYSEHPLAESVLRIANERGITLLPVKKFNNIPGKGIHAEIKGKNIAVLNAPKTTGGAASHISNRLRKEGKTILFVQIDENDAGILAAEDVLREDVSLSIRTLREMGIEKIRLISGDNRSAVKKISDMLGIDYEGEMSPEEKIQAIISSQENGQHVVMIGDGINDAPALAQADIGISMGKTGSDIAIETSHIALLREDWTLIPEAFSIAKRTMRIIHMNFLFTAIYNLIGLSLAAAGILPPTISAAMQSIPDIGIMANSARLLNQRSFRHTP